MTQYINIQSTNTADLIIEAATKNYRKVQVIFVPAYDESLHGHIQNNQLLTSLKKSKIEIFDFVEDLSKIFWLFKNKENVKSMKFIK